MNLLNNYNYVFFNQPDYRFGVGDGKGYNSICFRDLTHAENIWVYTSLFEHLNFVERWAYLVSRHITKFRWLNHFWYSKVDFSKGWKKQQPLCFIFITYLPIDHLTWLRKTYPDAKFVMFVRDLVSTRSTVIQKMINNKVIDRWITYDKGDAQKYNFFYYPEVESKIDLPTPSVYKHDVFFAGLAKNRLSQIIDIYDKLVSLGLKCFFYIKIKKGAPTIEREGIQYSFVNMKYEDILKENLQSKCILEINQEGAVGNTARFLEAVLYNKRLISNNLSIKESKFYTPMYICLFSKPNDITTDIFKDDNSVNYHYNNEFSPLKLIEYIASIL